MYKEAEAGSGQLSPASLSAQRRVGVHVYGHAVATSGDSRPARDVPGQMTLSPI